MWPSPPGNDCLEIFQPGFTPSLVYASFSGIMPGDIRPANGWFCPNNTFLFFQHDVMPCYWETHILARAGFFQINGTGAQVAITDKYRNGAFNTDRYPPGTTFFANKAQVPDFNEYYGGICQVMWKSLYPPPFFWQVLDLLNLQPSRDLFAEHFPIEEGKTSVKFCRKSDKTNISVIYNWPPPN